MFLHVFFATIEEVVFSRLILLTLCLHVFFVTVEEFDDVSMDGRHREKISICKRFPEDRRDNRCVHIGGDWPDCPVFRGLEMPTEPNSASNIAPIFREALDNAIGSVLGNAVVRTDNVFNPDAGKSKLRRITERIGAGAALAVFIYGMIRFLIWIFT